MNLLNKLYEKGIKVVNGEYLEKSVNHFEKIYAKLEKRTGKNIATTLTSAYFGFWMGILMEPSILIPTINDYGLEYTIERLPVYLVLPPAALALLFGLLGIPARAYIDYYHYTRKD